MSARPSRTETVPSRTFPSTSTTTLSMSSQARERGIGFAASRASAIVLRPAGASFSC